MKCDERLIKKLRGERHEEIDVKHVWETKKKS